MSMISRTLEELSADFVAQVPYVHGAEAPSEPLSAALGLKITFQVRELLNETRTAQ